MQAALPHQDAGDELHSKYDAADDLYLLCTAADDLYLLYLRRLLELWQRAEAERDRRAEDEQHDRDKEHEGAVGRVRVVEQARRLRA